MELRSVQVLRAVAAVLVVSAHARDQFPAASALLPGSFGLGGVDLFFVISGFVMTYSAGVRRQGPVVFLRRRWLRVAPLYWTMTGLTAGLLLAAPKLMRDSRFAWSDLLASLAFWPHANAGKPDSISPMLKLGWTLNYEAAFYVLFALCIGLAPLKRTAVLASAFAVLFAAARFGGLTGLPVGFWADPIVFEFALGCVIGAVDLKGLFTRAPVRSGWACLAVGSLVFLACADQPAHRLFSRGVASVLIVAGAVAAERAKASAFRWKSALFLGDASYSIYLGHLFPVVGLRALCTRLHWLVATPGEAAVFMSAAIGLGVGAGCLLHVWVERPLARLVWRASAR